MDYSELQAAVRKAPLPRHIAVIMDGNGRWGKAHNGGRTAGHRAGAESLRRIVEEARRSGIGFLTVFAFSTENWARPKEEIDLLMSLLDSYLDGETDNLLRQGIRLNFIGDYHRLSPKLTAKIEQSMAKTAVCRHMTLTIAINYGGRQDICRAARQAASLAAAGQLEPQSIDEAYFGKLLYTGHMPDVDLLIRTSGELRLSNFMLWQLAYAELYICDTLWPDFDEKGFLGAVYAFQGRKRRFGGI